MTEKEMNYEIYRALECAADQVWCEVKELLEEGSYTPMQVYDALMTMPKNTEQRSLKVEGFKCTFPVYHTFRLLHEFAKLAGVKTSERRKFVRTTEKEIVSSAIMRIEKRHKELKKMVDDDPSWRMLNYMYLDVEQGYLVASNRHILAAMKIDASMKKCQDEKKRGFLLKPDVADKPALMKVYANSDHSYSWRGNETFGTLQGDQYLRFPNWKGVLPMLSEELHYSIGADGVKQLHKFLKGVLKMPGKNGNKKDDHVLRIYTDSYEGTLHVRYDRPEYSVDAGIELPLKRWSERAIGIGIAAEQLVKITQTWNGSFWFVENCQPMTFDTDTQDTIIIMPCRIGEDEPCMRISNSGVKFDIHWYDRYGNRGTSNNNTIMGYELEKLAEGTYEVRGSKKKKLTESVRKMAQYMIGKSEVQIRAIDYFNSKYGAGKQSDGRYPLPEQELHDTLRDALLAQGICLGVESAGEPEAKPEPKPAPTGHLHVVQPSDPKPEPAPQQQEEPAVKIERTTAMVGRRFHPLLVLTEGDTQVVVAGNSLYEAISDEQGDVRPSYQELFDSTDAFIDDDLLTTDALDEAAICEAVCQFMDMVESAS